MAKFTLHSKFDSAGDQVTAIAHLKQGLAKHKKNQVLMGVTGSGKTFTMAQVIAETQRPALIMCHNKTLAAQLYNEMRGFFPENHVEYFVSYFDYYQPEAYLPSSDTYIDKDSAINDKLEQLKNSATYSILEHRDTVIVSSVSSIYGIGAVENYKKMTIDIYKGQEISIKRLTEKLVSIQYDRNDIELNRAHFSVKGDIVNIFPAQTSDYYVKISFFGNEIETIYKIDPLTGKRIAELKHYKLYSSSLYTTPETQVKKSLPYIQQELEERIAFFKSQEKYIEAQRIKERTELDMEMLREVNYCNGIEHYSRYISGREAGSTPPTIFDYLPEDTIIIVDESHVTIPQIRAMYNGDFNRKSTLANYGFRLPSCLDNRPLKFEEWDIARKDTIFVSATPGEWELETTSGEVVEQIIRPTGLLDPICIIKPLENQIEDLTIEIQKNIKVKEKTIAITLTKKMAENITEYFSENNVRAKYMHSDLNAIERVEIIKAFKNDEFDVLIGINLLREGIDIPECSTVAILDADKEGFLRSKTSLIQIIGRAARNINGKAILYADKITKSMQEAIDETKRRRKIQEEWNKKHNVTPKSTIANITESLDSKLREQKEDDDDGLNINIKELTKMRNKIEKEMLKEAKKHNFELAQELKEKLEKIDQKIISS